MADTQVGDFILMTNTSSSEGMHVMMVIFFQQAISQDSGNYIKIPGATNNFIKHFLLFIAQTVSRLITQAIG